MNLATPETRETMNIVFLIVLNFDSSPPSPDAIVIKKKSKYYLKNKVIDLGTPYI